MKTKEELKKMFDSLNDSEKYGVRFGLFPAKLIEYNLDRFDMVNLMDSKCDKPPMKKNN